MTANEDGSPAPEALPADGAVVADGSPGSNGEPGDAAVRRELDEALAALARAEESRDTYARELIAGARTTVGHLAWRWHRFANAHPGAARILRAPGGAVRAIVTSDPIRWLWPHPLFDAGWYIKANRDIAAYRWGPWRHYLRHGRREGRQPNAYFDDAWYLRTYPDVKATGMDPLEHYHRFGAWEGRDPSPRFDTRWYLAARPDVAAAGLDPLLHYLRHGAREGVLPRRMAVTGAPVVRRVGSGAPPNQSGGRVASPPDLTIRRQPQTDPGPALVVGARPRIDRAAFEKAVRRSVPAGARVGIVSEGQAELLKVAELDRVPVPRAIDGGPLTDPPRNHLSAIAHVEALRVSAFDYLAIPAPSIWLTAVPGLERHLRDRFQIVSKSGGVATVFDVRAATVGQGMPSASSATRRGDSTGQEHELDLIVERVRHQLERDPAILDWDSGLAFTPDLGSAAVLRPPLKTNGHLPYADGSIDIVLVRPRNDAIRDEARRVAGHTVVIAERRGGRDHLRVDDKDVPREGVAASVSIIVPTYDDSTLVAGCLRTLDETIPAWLDVEIIVSDDGSDERFVHELEAVVAGSPRARLLRNVENGGYIAAVSAGAREASKDILVFLNNDTLMLPGWLEALVTTFRSHPAAGVVGGMLLYPDGRLQEAGCAIFRDGSATKIGYRDDDPTLPWYAHVRSVDYVSGALFATPRDLFERLGGFDAAYGFGYYEDGDYCFRVRQEGRDVVYQPESVVIHVEGGSAGMDLTKGAKSYQARNQAIFVERWKAELASLPVRPEPLDLQASRDLIVRSHRGLVRA